MRLVGDRHAGRRRGLVLILVLIALATMALIGYSFESVMRTEYRAALVHGRSVQALALAKSGVDRALAMLVNPDTDLDELRNNVEALRAVATLDSSAEEPFTGRFSVVADDPDNDERPHYGVTSEAGKINIRTATREMLTGLPNVTEEMADSLIDWRDSDDTPEGLGAESAFYQAADVPYAAKNATFESVEELLMVRGWSARMLLGEDANRNGILDPNENDSDESDPPDNGDSRLEPGLASYLTIYSEEKNVDQEGQARVNLNDGDLDKLRTAIEREFGKEHADFVIHFREGKGMTAEAVAKEEAEAEKGSTSDNATSDNEMEDRTAPGEEGGDEKKEGASGATFGSVADLIGAIVELEVKKDEDDPRAEASRNNTRDGDDGEGEEEEEKEFETIESPFRVEDLDKMLDRLTTSKEKTLKGRVDVLWAPVAVLKALPGLGDVEAAAIVNGRSDIDPRNTHTAAWLVTREAISIEKFRKIEPLVTTRSYQWSIEAVGYFEDGGPRRRIRAVVDVRGTRPKYLYWRDLTSLGAAYDFRAERTGTSFY